VVSSIRIQNNDSIQANAGGQYSFAYDREHFIVGLQGGWFSGKTWVGARKLVSGHICNAINRKTLEPTLVPSVVVGPNYPNIMDFDVPEVRKALDECGFSYKWKEKGSVCKGNYAAPALIIPDLGFSYNPSVILFRSADTPRTITGWQVGYAWGDEPARWKEDYHNPQNDGLIQLFGRIRHPDANILQGIFTYTNEGDTTRIYDIMNSAKDDVALYTAPTKDNPAAKDFIKQQRQFLTPELAKQYLDGQAINLKGGRVYPSFEFIQHVTKNIDFVKGLPLQLSFDFNINPGMHLVMGNHIPHEDLLTAVYEFHSQGLNLKDLMVIFSQWYAHNKEKYDFPYVEVYGDSTGNSRSIDEGITRYDIIRTKLDLEGIEYKMMVPSCNPPIGDRVNAVEVALKDIEGETHYLIHRRCERLIKDYQKLKTKDNGTLDTQNNTLSHASDAEGYRIYQLRPIVDLRKYESADACFSVTV
jgi:hypothetical protein